jgi:hypothetical protein
MTIGSDGKHTFILTPGAKALLVEDQTRIATRYSERILPDLLADIETAIGDAPDPKELRDKLFQALTQILTNIRIPVEGSLNG